jgi:hypothetical protein
MARLVSTPTTPNLKAVPSNSVSAFTATCNVNNFKPKDGGSVA